MDFNAISPQYENKSLIQKGAAEFLFELLDLQKGESVLDVGCGTGNLTSRIKELTGSLVVGIDCSVGMIAEARQKYGSGIIFQLMAADNLPFEGEFDAVFCNSTFQWFTDPGPIVREMSRALKQGGRVGVQAPGGGNYCEQFTRALEAVASHPETGPVFRTWRNPWFMPETEAEYAAPFERAGLRVQFCTIVDVRTDHRLDEAWTVFSSGAIAGYLNPLWYGAAISKKYSGDFERVIRESFKKEARADGTIELHFRRIYLLARKEDA